MQFIAAFATGVEGVGYCEMSSFFCSESMPCAYSIANGYSTPLLWLMHRIVMHICYVCYCTIGQGGLKPVVSMSQPQFHPVQG